MQYESSLGDGRLHLMLTKRIWQRAFHCPHVPQHVTQEYLMNLVILVNKHGCPYLRVSRTIRLRWKG